MNEWLATNGIGGYAMGGVPGTDSAMNRRRYHGLLVAAASPPVGRVVALHSVVDRVQCGHVAAELATQQFAPIDAPVTHPDGWRHLQCVEHRLPDETRWTYLVNGTRITRTLKMHRHRNAVDLSWSSDGPFELYCRVFTPMRDFHALSKEHDGQPPAELLDERTLCIVRWDMQLHLRLSHGTWTHRPLWWRDFFYAEDHQRGQDCTEDVWSPGEFHALCEQSVSLHAELVQPRHVAKQIRTQTAAQHDHVPEDAAVARLHLAADQFVVLRRMDETAWSTSIIAGYPWFADWGRDTMISLPGLLLCTGRLDEAESTLLTFARHVHNGLIPNRFDDYGGAAHYNTVDGSLWFVHAVHALHETRQGHVHPQLISACRSIVAAYRKGTDYGIAMQSDSLIAAGSAETQLTWMDARRDGITFTPRHGKAVEINALWHHALHCLARMTGDPSEARDLVELAEIVAGSFRRAFWNQQRGCCYDVISPVEPDGWLADEAIRPNQIFAVSLAPSPLTHDQQKQVVKTVRRELLTPYGLRTLEQGHRSYRGRFEGDLLQRDAAYHQGTVWPWLMGAYVEANLRVNSFSDASVLQARDLVATLLAELDHGCHGQLAEVYDGDEPHRPSGCPAQAWSVAEILRVLHLCGQTARNASVSAGVRTIR